jgi:hypothetical protein
MRSLNFNFLGEVFQVHLMMRTNGAAHTCILRYLSSWVVALYRHGSFDAAICFVALARAKSFSMLPNVIIRFYASPGLTTHCAVRVPVAVLHNLRADRDTLLGILIDTV